MNKISEKELEKINLFSRKKLTADEVFSFSVNLCDNEIDRDGERFEESTLREMAPLFIGKTAISDHAMKSENQIARTYDAFVEAPQGKKNSLGEQYYVLRAKAYMPITEKNKAFIEEIEAGIKKEVSISCSVKERICSVCGKNMNSGACTHKVGREYASKKCHALLRGVSDVYEWSFVAVPAQKNAGVTKSFKIRQEEKGFMEIIKTFAEAQSDLTIDKASAKAIAEYVESLEEEAQNGRAYKSGLCDEIKKLCSVVLPNLESEAAQKITKALSVSELLELKKALSDRAEKIMPLNVQLSEEKSVSSFDGANYKI